ncbi:hypothetical protein [Shewanella maritima]|uniref:hypothetical protein n=1 Tax=Shewanella maritima TaxID=2520507 RepID=UPI003735E814
MKIKGIVFCSAMLAFVAQAEDAAEKAFTDEVVQCAAYYEISSQMIGAMNAPQMQAVGDRLKVSAVDAKSLAEQYREPSQVKQDLDAAKELQMAKLSGGNNLGVLMRQYKDLCKQVVYSPKDRLEYWAMATM